MQLNLKDEGGPQLNLETSNGECDKSDKGNICRVKVKRGALARAKELKESELYAVLLYVSWCGRRASYWPTAKDLEKAVKEVRVEFSALSKSYPYRDICDCIARIDEWDDSLVKDELEQMREVEEERERSKISNSPLFRIFHLSYPHISPDDFNKEYDPRSDSFSQTAVYLLRKSFKENQPPEITTTGPWSQSWLQYLPEYQELWLKDIRKMERRTSHAQNAWRESIS